MTRHTFLRTVPLLAAAAAAPSLAFASGSAAGRKQIIGHGDFRYKVDAKWGALDAHKFPVQHCYEMVMDSQQRLVCTVASSKASLLVYQKDGKLAHVWRLGLTTPHGITRSGEGEAETYLVTDSGAGRVLQLATDGRLIRELFVPARYLPAGQRFRPTGTSVASNGDVYVADGGGTRQIFHFDAKGQLQNVFGGPEHFAGGVGLLADGRRGAEELLISDRAGATLQRWSLSGEPLRTRALPGLHVCRPVRQGEHTLLAVLSTRDPMAYDGMLAVLDADLRVVSLPGGSAPTRQDDFTDVVSDERSFLNPHDVCPDEDGNLYVPQWFSGKTYPVRLRRIR